jgi:hypothetical protein
MDFGHGGMPLLSLEDEARDFDYAAFLQDAEDIDAEYLSAVSSASTSANLFQTTSATSTTRASASNSESPRQLLIPPPNMSSSSSTAPLSPSSGQSSGLVSKQRLERRGHTKSRRGCFNCKRRRIKVCSRPFFLFLSLSLVPHLLACAWT